MSNLNFHFNDCFYINRIAERLKTVNRLVYSSSVLSWDFFKLYLGLFHTVYESHRCFKKLNSIIKKHRVLGDFQDSEKFTKEYLDSATRIRNSLSDISQNIKDLESPPFSINFFMTIIAFLLDRAVIDWDDFVVDLTISRDTELNKTLSLLSDAI